MAANSGKGAAVRRGLQAVDGDLIVIQDADLRYDPADLSNVVNAYCDRDVNVVFGSRCLALQSCHGRHVYRWGGRLITWLTNILYGSRLTDQPTCYKSFRAEVLSDVRLCSTGFEFCVVTAGGYSPTVGEFLPVR